MARVGVVVVTYRSATTIGACLASLRAASSEPLELVVVDNGSDDDSVAVATAADANALVVSRPTNDGYGVANNAGVATLAPDTEFVLLANPDTEWPAHSIDSLVALLGPTVGLISPSLAGDGGAIQPIVEHDLTLRDAVLGMLRLRRPVRPGWASVNDDLTDVDWLHTAAALMPLRVFSEVGGFDERFFLFAEDADLCRRVRATGRRVVITPRVIVRHVGGASMDASHDADTLAGMRTRAVATYLEKYQGKLARRVFGAFGTAVYGAARHRGQAREAWRALTR